MTMSAQATVSSAHAAARRWDAIVVGAGPAGSAAAIALRRRGAAVLLVEKCSFPRAKVCGCCVSSRALATIESLGAGARVRALGGVAIRELRLMAGGRTARLALRGGISVSRAALDAAMVQRAIDVGAHFLPGMNVRATDMTSDERTVTGSYDGALISLSARVVIAAGGLAGRWVSLDPSRAARSSLMGASCHLPQAPAGVDAGAITMACGRGGYAGVVQLEDGSAVVTAALEPAMAQALGGPAAMVARLFAHAGLRVSHSLHAESWKGTPLLTRRRARCAGHRVLVAGDAAGFVEPFTGEGIAWALEAGAAAGAHAARALPCWDRSHEAAWERAVTAMFTWRWRRCGMIAHLLRHPTIVVPAVAALSFAPALAAPLVRGVQGTAAFRPAFAQ